MKNIFQLFLTFCVQVSVEGSSDGGYIKIKLKGRKEAEVYFSKPVLGFKSGQNYTQLVTDSQNWGQITEGVVSFGNNFLGKLRKFSKKLNPLRSRQEFNIKINRIAINFMSHIEDRYVSKLF